MLTDRDEVDEGAIETEDTYVLVVNLPRYLEVAHSDAAAAYLAQRLGRGITRAKSFSEFADDDEIARVLEARLDEELLARWAGDNASRLELLRTIGETEEDGGNASERDYEDRVSRALAALDALGELDPRVTESIAALVLTEEDLEARAELLWALTQDTEGRYATAETLQGRTTERLDDARAAASEFERLLKTGGETDVQEFLEANPWLLGLDYAQIRPRQQIPRGAVDFLLERFDGLHDLLELK